MVSLCLGSAAFVLYLVYDINSFTGQRKILRSCFFAGTCLLAAATGMDLWQAWRSGGFSGIMDGCLLAGAALCFAALIYSLFFALPFKETYARQTDGRQVYRCGVYALCRHPGILCFFAVYLLMGLAALPNPMIRNCLIFSVLNLAYAWFQDQITFPRTFCDYDDYKKQVPFLIPTKNSISMACRTLSCAHDKEDAQ